MTAYSPEGVYLGALVEALAKQAVADYLAPEAAPGNAPDPERPNPAPLPALDKAA